MFKKKTCNQQCQPQSQSEPNMAVLSMFHHPCYSVYLLTTAIILQSSSKVQLLKCKSAKYPIKIDPSILFTVIFIDPFEQWNRVHALTDGERSYLRDQLAQLKACRGTKQCTVGISASSASQLHTSSNTASISSMGNAASVSSVGIRYKKRKYPSSSKFTTGKMILR
jgi:hypothetical protein